MRANVIKDMITTGLGDISELTIGEVLTLKTIFGLSDSEAIHIFLGGARRENIQV